MRGTPALYAITATHRRMPTRMLPLNCISNTGRIPKTVSLQNAASSLSATRPSNFGHQLGYTFRITSCESLGALVSLPRFSPQMVKWCSMHTLNLGLEPILMGSVFDELLTGYSVWGGDQLDPACRLALAFDKYVAWCRANKIVRPNCRIHTCQHHH